MKVNWTKYLLEVFI